MAYFAHRVVGIDWDSSWEAEILSRTEHCEIWGFDYAQEGFGPDVRSLQHRTHFKQLQLGPRDSHGPDDDPKVYTLQSVMLENGKFFRPSVVLLIRAKLMVVLQAILTSIFSKSTSKGGNSKR